jgi:hypothetical protein
MYPYICAEGCCRVHILHFSQPRITVMRLFDYGALYSQNWFVFINFNANSRSIWFLSRRLLLWAELSFLANCFSRRELIAVKVLRSHSRKAFQFLLQERLFFSWHFSSAIISSFICVMFYVFMEHTNFSIFLCSLPKLS